MSERLTARERAESIVDTLRSNHSLRNSSVIWPVDYIESALLAHAQQVQREALEALRQSLSLLGPCGISEVPLTVAVQASRETRESALMLVDAAIQAVSEDEK